MVATNLRGIHGDVRRHSSVMKPTSSVRSLDTITPSLSFLARRRGENDAQRSPNPNPGDRPKICGHILLRGVASTRKSHLAKRAPLQTDSKRRAGRQPVTEIGLPVLLPIPLAPTTYQDDAMATTAAIGIPAFPRPLSGRPRATSTARLRTFPRCRPLVSCSSASSASSSSTAAAAFKHGSTSGSMGPAARSNATLQRSPSSDLRRGLIVPNATTGGAGTTSGSSSGLLPTVLGAAHLIVSLGIVLATDKFLKQAFLAASIKFPSSLFGMFCVFSVLLVFDTFAPALAKAFMDFFEPATLFIQRWLPLFYVPSLVVLPLAVRDIPAASGLKIFVIIFGGWFASLAVAGYTALAVRKLVKTQLIPAEPMSKPSPFSALETWAWAAIFIASFGAAYFNPTALGDYLTKAASNPGAGDVLMSFLGSVIISFAFAMFKQRKLAKRHAAEIFTSIAIASTFSLYSTAVLGRLIGLEPTLTISILPRCITLALALSIVSFFEGVNSSLTAAVVVLTGLIGANFVQAALDKLGLNDPIARGIGTASSAHGFGTAALSANEPEALPFCAIAYGLTGILGSLICSVPAPNLVSLYHLSLRAATSPPLLPSLQLQLQQQLEKEEVPHADDEQEALIRQLGAIRAGVSQLNHLRSSSPPPPPPPPELVLYSRLAPVASACAARTRTSSTATCPTPPSRPAPTTRSPSPSRSSSAAATAPPPQSLGFDVARTEAARFLRARGPLDLTAPQLLRLASLGRAGPIRLGLDIGGGTGTLAARLKKLANATVVTTTMNLGAPYSEAAAARGVVPLHAPLQQRFPVGDGTMDVVRAGHAVNRWIPEAALEFLWYDADRALRPGGLLWVDHFWCRRADLEGVYAAMLRRLGYKTIKWAVGDKTVAAGGNRAKDEVYLTALLQKPFS
ncbi:hypothetical protein PR202_ga07974 [Eleusine coracana subsp. coracana]|uniref:Methyltransferase type 11 domain-containing protein n=1 Tax=Eleusine coracana subsp. coracana TaxID=191504 RepID=A0AAV5BYY2_ELECO|nr:hypothetical protein PR202_ga07974 [Eleusine coracana subsp. coracana]